MKKEKYVKVKTKNINGLVNSQLVIEGRLFIPEKYNELEVYCDDKLIKSNMRKIGARGNFILYAPVKKEMKKLKIYLLVDKEKVLITSINNNLNVRIRSRFRILIKRILKPFKKIGHGISFLWREHHFLVPPTFWGKYLKVVGLKIKHIFVKDTYYPFNTKNYNKWISKHEQKTEYKELKYQPLISILIPVYNIEREYLSECLDSILNQKYQNFEVCLADDCSTKAETKETLKEYEKKR